MGSKKRKAADGEDIASPATQLEVRANAHQPCE
jgi:hypothetical protein